MGARSRFVAVRYERERDKAEQGDTEQYQLFETAEYTYRVFVTNLTAPIAEAVWLYSGRAGAENLIKEANNDAGFAHPSKRFDVNSVHFQMVMLGYNLNCWLLLLNREPEQDVAKLRHTTLATARLRFLFIAAKIWKHAGRTGISYSDHYEEQGLFQRLMDRLREIALDATGYRPVIEVALR